MKALNMLKNLAAAGVQAELYIHPGMVYVFDGIAPEIEMSKDFWRARTNALKKAFKA